MEMGIEMSVRKVALVTGSATGIGRATAVRFAKLGYDVVVNYSRSEAEAKETLALVEAEGVKLGSEQHQLSLARSIMSTQRQSGRFPSPGRPVQSPLCRAPAQSDNG